MWLDELSGHTKPIIGMCHLPALPGDPIYGTEGLDLPEIVRQVREDVKALQDGGISAIMFSNEFSLPYLTKTEPITAITMGRIIGEVLSDVTVPYGVNVLWDGRASLDLAVATGAAFVREIFTGVYASDFGLWDTAVGETARHRASLNASNVKMLFNILPEAASYLGNRNLADITRSTVFNCKPDGLCVSGLTAGSSTDMGALETVKANAGSTPVFVNTGVKPATAERLLEVADAAVVGTSLKRDGRFENRVERQAVERLVESVGALRSPAAILASA